MLDTVIIANSHDKDGNKVDIKSKMENTDDFLWWNWQFGTLKI